jgi:hypothetical protein
MIKTRLKESVETEKFHEDLINLYTSAVKSCDCQPISLSSVVAQGGVIAAKNYLRRNTVRSGLFPLSEYGNKRILFRWSVTKIINHRRF